METPFVFGRLAIKKISPTGKKKKADSSIIF
jgi:hypothetical protein